MTSLNSSKANRFYENRTTKQIIINNIVHHVVGSPIRNLMSYQNRLLPDIPLRDSLIKKLMSWHVTQVCTPRLFWIVSDNFENHEKQIQETNGSSSRLITGARGVKSVTTERKSCKQVLMTSFWFDAHTPVMTKPSWRY